MKMSGPLKDSFENLKTRNSASRILTGIFSKKLENSELSQNLGLKFVTRDISIGNSMICSDIWHKYHE